MASRGPNKTLKRKASGELSRFTDPIQATLNTPSNCANHISKEPSPEGEHNGKSIDQLAPSPSSEAKIDIAERVSSYLERNSHREGGNGEHEAHQDESQFLLRELLVAYQAKCDQLNEIESSASQVEAEKQEGALQLKKFLGEPRRISTKGVQDLLEGVEGKDDANDILLRIERIMNNIHNSSLNSPYAMVLLDGDGYIFNEDLIRQGLKGGEIAAEQLETELRNHFERNNFKGQSGWRVAVFIFASIDALAHKMKKSGRTLEAKSFRQFTIGLNQSEGLVNVVDVGPYCKEGTDYKIRTFFDLFISDVNLRCRHVVLGCSHDRGYLRMLARYKHKASHKDSITLLETRVTAEGFQHMPFKKLQLHNLLISSTILNSPPDGVQQSPAASKHLVPAPKHTAVGTPASKGIPCASENLHTTMYPRCVAVNASNQRVDIALPQPTTQIASRAAQKYRTYLQSCIETGVPKPCQEWHLAGQCAYGNSCALDHILQLDQAQIEEMARIARQHPCPAGFTCRDKNCVLGHSCPYDGIAQSCAYPENCRLIQFHGLDTRIVEMWDPVGNAVSFASAT